MTYVISHTTALEVMRLRRFPDCLDRRDPELKLPQKLPGSGEVERWASSTPLLAQLRRPLDLLVSTTNGSARALGFSAHCTGADLPADGLILLDGNTAIVPPELLALQFAQLATPLELVLLLCELCGTYSIQPACDGGLLQRSVPLTTLSKVLGYAQSLIHVPGSKALKDACALAFDLCASPMESRLACRIAWPRSRGGYNVPILSMNEPLVAGGISRNDALSHLRRPDIVFRMPVGPVPGIGLEYSGDVHAGGDRARLDDLRMNEMTSAGMKLYTIWHEEYRSTAYMDGLIDRTIRRDLGLPLPRTNKLRASLELARREALLTELDVIDGMSWGISSKALEVVKARELVSEAEDFVAAARRR